MPPLPSRHPAHAAADALEHEGIEPTNPVSPTTSSIPPVHLNGMFELDIEDLLPFPHCIYALIGTPHIRVVPDDKPLTPGGPCPEAESDGTLQVVASTDSELEPSELLDVDQQFYDPSAVTSETSLVDMDDAELTAQRDWHYGQAERIHRLIDARHNIEQRRESLGRAMQSLAKAERQLAATVADFEGAPV